MVERLKAAHALRPQQSTGFSKPEASFVGGTLMEWKNSSLTAYHDPA
jgi:hypothetical protein